MNNESLIPHPAFRSCAPSPWRASYDPSRPLVWIHLPKAAGTSVRHIVQDWFGTDRVFPHYRGQGSAMMSPLSPDPGAGSVIYGHFNRERGFGTETLPFRPEQFLTILRDPLQKHVSAFFYLNQATKSRGAPSPSGGDSPEALERWIREEPVQYLQHFPEPVTEANVQQVLDRFLFVGLFEFLPESLAAIGEILGKRFGAHQLQHDNKSERFTHVPDAESVARFRDRHALEYRVYWHVLERFAQHQRARLSSSGQTRKST